MNKAMKKILMTFVAVLAMAVVGAKAQDTVFSYTYQGQTLYYVVDSTNNAMLVARLGALWRHDARRKAGGRRCLLPLL